MRDRENALRMNSIAFSVITLTLNASHVTSEKEQDKKEGGEGGSKRKRKKKWRSTGFVYHTM